jgi:glycosyltransferase involved in cell wall biosynthesis
MARIWFAANQGDLGGGEVMTLHLATAARALGHDARIVCPAEPNRLLAAATAAGFRTVAVRGRSGARYAANLAAWDVAERSGLLWANGLRTAAATAGHLNRVVHLHQLPRGKQSWVLPVARFGARVLVVPSRFLADRLPGAVVLPNWTVSFAKPRFDRRLFGPSRPYPVRLGFLGRPSTLKGVDVLAEALALLDRERPGGYRLLLAGEPAYLDRDDRARTETALAPVAHLVDRVGWMERTDFFDTVDLAVFPSVIEESFGLVVAEAMSVGCPYVITSAGALPEVAGEHLYVAASADPASLAGTIAHAVTGYSRSMAEDAHDRWQDCFSPEAGLVALEALLGRLLETGEVER